MSKMSGFAKGIKYRFHNLKSLKSSFSFLKNVFTVDVVDNRCPVSSLLPKDAAAVELKVLELQKNKGLKGPK